ncbi:hypothetical protein D3C81_2151820 [compost metagenome]
MEDVVLWTLDIEVDRVAIGLNHSSIIGSRLKQSLNLQAVYSRLQQNMQVLQNANIIGAHNMGAVLILVNREFLILAFRFDQK